MCQVAGTNKNPRVKQLILEKSEAILLESSERVREDELISIFKLLKDKLLAFIHKDTNAAVRDAGVSLLTAFKALLFDHPLVTETVNTLPKYRISEINKLAEERANPKGAVKAEPNSHKSPRIRPVSGKE